MSRSRLSRQLRSALVLPLVVAGCSLPVDSATTHPVTVIKVVDGDTFDAVAGGESVTIRILAVDTPEEGRSGRPAECLAEEATALTTRLLQQGPVTLVDDPTQPRRDRYGRRLAYVDAAGDDVGHVLVREGLAEVWRDPDRPAARLMTYEDAERQARTGWRGIWSRC